jgi:hypothetical protein
MHVINFPSITFRIYSLLEEEVYLQKVQSAYFCFLRTVSICKIANGRRLVSSVFGRTTSRARKMRSLVREVSQSSDGKSRESGTSSRTSSFLLMVGDFILQLLLFYQFPVQATLLFQLTVTSHLKITIII